jgi:urease gamma subunit
MQRVFQKGRHLLDDQNAIDGTKHVSKKILVEGMRHTDGKYGQVRSIFG